MPPPEQETLDSPTALPWIRWGLLLGLCLTLLELRNEPASFP
jgi:hypothetical protein